jgi:hypothetical protein
MNYYTYALLVLSIYGGKISGAAHASSDTTFTDTERSKARAFIRCTLNWLTAHNEKKMYDAQIRGDRRECIRYKRALRAIGQAVWDEDDERQARKMYYDVLVMPAWKSYMRHRTSVAHWGVVYRDMHGKHGEILEYRFQTIIKTMDKDARKDFMNKLNMITYLTTFLLVEQFRTSNPISTQMVHKPEGTGRVPTQRAMRPDTLRRVVSLQSLSVLPAGQDNVQTYRSLPPRTREKHERGLRSVDARKVDALEVEKRVEWRPEEGLIVPFIRHVVGIAMGWV